MGSWSACMHAAAQGHQGQPTAASTTCASMQPQLASRGSTHLQTPQRLLALDGAVVPELALQVPGKDEAQQRGSPRRDAEILELLRELWGAHATCGAAQAHALYIPWCMLALPQVT